LGKNYFDFLPGLVLSIARKQMTFTSTMKLSAPQDQSRTVGIWHCASRLFGNVGLPF
jgi:hypothetical protein